MSHDTKKEEVKKEEVKKEDSFVSLFSSYFWLGIVMNFLSILLDLEFPHRSLLFSVGINFIESIGISIVVATIFTYISGTSEFINKIQKLLQDIVVSRNFLGNIDAESKREALNSLIKPSVEEKRIYSNIEDYLNNYVKQTMDVMNKNVRSNYTVSSRAYVNHKLNQVFVDSNISYRLYPTKNGYSEIKVGFLAADVSSTCKRLIVSTPHGKRTVFDNFKFENIEIDAGNARVATVDLSEYEESCTHLDISLELSEAGSDHWIMLSFCTLMPTDGFIHNLRCEDNLVINTYQTYIYGAKFHVDKISDIEMTAACNEWINEGTGLSILISIPHEVTSTNGVINKGGVD